MAFFGKMYKLERTENFEDFVHSLKLPPADTQAYINSRSTQKLDKNGDEYVITTFYDGKSSEMKFKSGVEFDEVVNSEVIPKSTITVEGNKLTHVQTFQDGNTITYVREYSPEELVVTVTANFWPGTAKRFYSAQ
ncbi:fatty acid-binding protein 2-like [Zerene cesonia]|uniref:fatty acid-binding protein 2-like n=1 Tax=Zerene cesonia TaxID=33412 RepID=UPI0018E54144|nr:fatty acid-binding protein 2-like [Zerene cesonia]